MLFYSGLLFVYIVVLILLNGGILKWNLYVCIYILIDVLFGIGKFIEK